MTEQEIIKIFEESGALLTGHFKLRSGLHSNRFFQAALLLQYPDKAEKVCQFLAEQFKAIGVTANIELIEWETWLSEVYKERNFEATVVGLDASTLTAGALLARFESTAHNNFCNYHQ